MHNYIKYLVEAFDFNSVKKQNKKVNVVDTVLKYIIPKIDNREKLSQDDYDNILKNSVGIYKVSEKKELKDLIDYFIEQFGNECNLNWIDVSNVTDMSYMFYDSNFNGDISQWNISNVTVMCEMFYASKFTGNISQWNVSNVTDMSCMFMFSKFNGNISQWNVSSVINMASMFYKSVFNGDISNWDVSNVTDKYKMFFKCPIKSKYKPKFK